MAQINRTLLSIAGVTHYPVLYRPVDCLVSDFLTLYPPSHHIQLADCTFGGGNHSVPLLQ